MVETSPFDKLPDELVLKIIKLVMESHKRTWPMDLAALDSPHWQSPHDFLLKTIARISIRFKRIAADKSLWRGSYILSEGTLLVHGNTIIPCLTLPFKFQSISKFKIVPTFQL